MYGRFGLPDDERPWELYFDGQPQKSSEYSSSKKQRDVLIEGSPRSLDLSEGIDEMSLIQKIGIQIKNDSEEVKDDEQEVEENSDGFFIRNIRNDEVQKVSDSRGRMSLTLKIIKTPEISKSYTVLSSYNRDAKASVNDRIIGYVYKEGNILRFARLDGKNWMDIKI